MTSAKVSVVPQTGTHDATSIENRSKTNKQADLYTRHTDTRNTQCNRCARTTSTHLAVLQCLVGCCDRRLQVGHGNLQHARQPTTAGEASFKFNRGAGMTHTYRADRTDKPILERCFICCIGHTPRMLYKAGLAEPSVRSRHKMCTCSPLVETSGKRV